MLASTANLTVSPEPPPESGLFAIPQPNRASHRCPTVHRKPASKEVSSRLDAHLPALRRRALYLARRRSEADDLVQDTVERALRFAGSYQPGTNLRAWLLQIMYSVFASRCRRSQRERAAHSAMCTDPNLGVSHKAPATDDGVVLGSFVRQLQALPQVYAEVLWLIDYQDFAYTEAAEHLNVPLGTVMSRLHRARRSLRGALDPVTDVG